MQRIGKKVLSVVLTVIIAVSSCVIAANAETDSVITKVDSFEAAAEELTNRKHVDELEKDERIDGLYNLWYEKKNETIRIYTDEVPERIPLSMNKEFKSIKNMIIQEALNINLDVIITNLPASSHTGKVIAL